MEEATGKDDTSHCFVQTAGRMANLTPPLGEAGEHTVALSFSQRESDIKRDQGNGKR